MSSAPTKPECPQCSAPLALGGRYCHQCGWDEELAGTEDAYLDGIDVPQGYAAEDHTAVPHSAPPRGARILTWIIFLLFGGFLVFSIFHRMGSG